MTEFVAEKAAKNLTTDQIINLGGKMMDQALKKWRLVKTLTA